MKSQTIALTVVALLSAAMGIYAAQREADQVLARVEKQNGPAKGDAVQQFFTRQMPDAQGVAQAMKQWQGKPLIINFWASWCAPCVEEMPALSKMQQQLAPRGVQIIGIGIDAPSAIKEFNQKHQIAYPLLIGGMEGSELARSFGNKAGGLPFTVLIGADGKIKKTYLGILNIEQFYMEIQSIFALK